MAAPDSGTALWTAAHYHGGLAGNIENDLLYEVTQKFDLQFLEFAPESGAER